MDEPGRGDPLDDAQRRRAPSVGLVVGRRGALVAEPDSFLLVAHWIDMVLGALTPAQWDSWRNWVTAVGGLIALFIATSTYRRNVRIKREEQARLVYSKSTDVELRNPGDKFPVLPNGAQVGTGSPGVRINTVPALGGKGWTSEAEALTSLLQVTVVVHNGSKELIGPIRVELLVGGKRLLPSLGIAEVEPDTNFVLDFTWVSPAGIVPSLESTILFRDSSAQWWRRHRSQPIERVHNDPENVDLPAAERITARAAQKALGISEDKWVQEPKVPLAARWHRFWRKVRGKNPIP